MSKKVIGNLTRVGASLVAKENSVSVMARQNYKQKCKRVDVTGGYGEHRQEEKTEVARHV